MYIETVVLATLAAGLIVAGGFPLPGDPLGHLSSFLVERAAVIRCLMIIYGIVLAVVSVVSGVTIRCYRSMLCTRCVHWSRSLLQEAHATWRWLCEVTAIKGAAAWLFPMVAVGTGLRCYFLAQPMRYDEAYTFLNFVNQSLPHLFYYPLPNNHVLHTLLVRVSVTFLGSHPASIRLPAFLAGISVIPLTFCLARLLTRNSRSGYLASAFVAVFPYLVLYDTMARGYSLLVLLSVLLAMFCYRLIEEPSMSSCLFVALLIALGLLDMPSFLFPAAGLLLWALVMLVLEGHRLIWVLIHVLMPCGIMVVLFTGLLYTPTVLASNGVGTLVANPFVEGLPWPKFLDRLPGHIHETAVHFMRDVPSVISWFFLLLAGGTLGYLVWKRYWKALALFVLLVFGSAVVLFAKHAIPYPRTWIYLLPFIAVVLDISFAAMMPPPVETYAKRAFLLLAGFVALVLMSQNPIASYVDTGTFPEAMTLVETLAEQMGSEDEVVVGLPANAPMEFYMWYLNVPRASDVSTSDPEAPSQVFYVVKPSGYAITDLTNGDVQRILKIGDAELYVSEGVGDRGASQ